MTVSRDGLPGVGFIAVHTTAQYNPRTLLSYEAMGRNNRGHSALQLPEGHSRQDLTRPEPRYWP